MMRADPLDLFPSARPRLRPPRRLAGPGWRCRISQGVAALSVIAAVGVANAFVSLAAHARDAAPIPTDQDVVVRTPPGATAIDAGTFDKGGHRIGRSHFELETSDTGMRHLKVMMGIDAGGENVAEAIFAPVVGAFGGARTDLGPAPLRVVKEHAQARNAEGESLEYLVIDHAARRVSCYPPDRDPARGKHVDMPKGGQVVNVSIQLLLTPLAVGDVDEMNFHIALCKDGPVLYKMAALRGPTTRRDDREIVEVRYGPDLGPMSWLASRLLPKFSFWFDKQDGAYVGHRMPLHTKGPEILLVRDGFSPRDFGFD